MAQICRVSKLEAPVLLRTLRKNYKYSTRHKTYYDVLRIPKTASQKEIREAFLKLSKEMHPDNVVKGNHDDFVQLNQAYSVLIKKDSRHYYNMSLEDGKSMSYYVETTAPRVVYDFDRVPNQENVEQDKFKKIQFCVTLMFIGCLLISIEILLSNDRHNRIEKYRQCEQKYEEFREQREEFFKSVGYKLKPREE